MRTTQDPSSQRGHVVVTWMVTRPIRGRYAAVRGPSHASYVTVPKPPLDRDATVTRLLRTSAAESLI